MRSVRYARYMLPTAADPDGHRLIHDSRLRGQGSVKGPARYRQNSGKRGRAACTLGEPGRTASSRCAFDRTLTGPRILTARLASRRACLNLKGAVTMSADTTLTCRDCGQAFTFTSGEQDFYASRGFS